MATKKATTTDDLTAEDLTATAENTLPTREQMVEGIVENTDPDETAQVEWWIQSAELQIRSRLGDLAELDQDVLTYVIVEAVAAKAQNPEGAQSETIDDYTYRLPAESRRVTILPEWWNLLDPDSGSGVFSARPYFVADDSPIASLDWS